MPQFGLRSLFILTFVAAILLAVCRLRGLIGALLGFDAMVLSAIGHEFLRGKSRTTERSLDLLVSSVLFVAALMFLIGALLL
jgi:hypothetical protein